MMRVGVLASGGGTNLQALLDGLNVEGSPARVVVVICNVEGAGAIDRAKRAGVPAVVLPHQRWPNRAAYDAAVAEELKRHGVEVVCLAGYLRLVSPSFLRAFPQGVLNVHPALLPSFPGLHGARQALEAGVRVTGCTVHFVDEGTDTGPIIAQAAVPVLPGDDEAALQQRIQAQEHRLYPRAVAALANGQIRLLGRAVTLTEPLT